MTLSAFSPTNASGPTPASNRLAPSGSAVTNVGRVCRSATVAVGKAIVILVAYRAALKRLEAGVEGNLFDEPVLWAEIKSMAWAEAGEAAEHWKDRLPAIGAFASGVSFLLAISVLFLACGYRHRCIASWRYTGRPSEAYRQRLSTLFLTMTQRYCRLGKRRLSREQGSFPCAERIWKTQSGC